MTQPEHNRELRAHAAVTSPIEVVPPAAPEAVPPGHTFHRDYLGRPMVLPPVNFPPVSRFNAEPVVPVEGESLRPVPASLMPTVVDRPVATEQPMPPHPTVHYDNMGRRIDMPAGFLTPPPISRQ